MYLAVSGLQRENAELRRQLIETMSTELKECQRVITEHRAEERDRDFNMKQLVQLEGVRTRDATKEICRP
jgi:hypothetical protein